MPARSVPYTPRPYVRDNSLGSLLQLQGRNRAESERERGAISAQMWASLGQQIAQSIQSYTKDKQEAPIRAQEAEARTIGLENARAEQASARKATEDTSIMGSAMGSRMPPEQIKAQLAEFGRGDLIPVFDKTWMDLESSRTSLKKLKADVEAGEADYFGAFAAGIKKSNYDPMAIEWALSEAEADGHDVAQLKQQIQGNPQMLPQLVDHLIERSPTQREMVAKEQKAALEQQQEQRQSMETMEQIAARNRDDRRQSDTLAETSRHNRAMEVNARQGTGTDDPGPLETIIGPDGKPIRVARKDAVGKPPASGTQKPASGLEKRALNFFNRARQADVDLEQLEPEIAGMGLAGQARMAYAHNTLQSETGQLYTQAQRAFTEARLRKDSGAAIPEQEFKNDRQTYFAQPGDSEVTLDQKRRARAAVLSSLAFESGQALGEFVGDADEARAMVDSYKERSTRKDGAANSQTPNLSGLKDGTMRKFRNGPFAGQEWAIVNGEAQRIK